MSNNNDLGYSGSSSIQRPYSEMPSEERRDYVRSLVEEGLKLHVALREKFERILIVRNSDLELLLD